MEIYDVKVVGALSFRTRLDGVVHERRTVGTHLMAQWEPMRAGAPRRARPAVRAVGLQARPDR
ncbi:hypothetical protein GCM10026982_10630 [Nocardiopsis aegyptia]